MVYPIPSPPFGPAQCFSDASADRRRDGWSTRFSHPSAPAAMRNCQACAGFVQAAVDACGGFRIGGCVCAAGSMKENARGGKPVSIAGSRSMPHGGDEPLFGWNPPSITSSIA